MLSMKKTKKAALVVCVDDCLVIKEESEELVDVKEEREEQEREKGEKERVKGEPQ